MIAALALAERGWLVHPLAPGGKRPLTSHGWKDATADPATVERWWCTWPRANVGIACAPSGLVVIDVDPRNGGDDELHQLERELGALPASVECLTGGGGRHVYLRDPDAELRGELAPGVDLKHHGYVLAPPSRTTGPYVWACDREPGAVVLAAVPERWLAAMRAPKRPARAVREHDDYLLAIPPPEYFALLAEVIPDRRGFVRCPLPDHEDRTPSCQVWPTAERGWYCHGCKRGGTIYDLAGHLAGEPLRGAAFLRVHESLLTFLERRLGVAA